MGGPIPKQFRPLGTLPLLVHSLQVFETSGSVVEIVVAVHEEDREYCVTDIVGRYGLRKVHQIVIGGEQRQDSVRRAVAAVSPDTEIVLVHDAARPFVTGAMVEALIQQAVTTGAAVVAVPIGETVKRVSEHGMIVETVDRRGLWLAQTPQAFRRSVLEQAHTEAYHAGLSGTDDAQLVERLGHPVAIVEGSTENIKITRPEDVMIGEAIFAARRRAGRAS